MGWKDRKALARALRAIDTAPTAEAAAREWDACAAGAWGRRFPTIVKNWRAAWTRSATSPRSLTTKAARHWRETVHQFAILYGDRFLRGQA